MNFVGTGKRFAQGDIGDAARLLGVETAVLLAFIEVEAAGRGFDAKNRLKMLRETHIFYRELGAGAKRDRAVSVGLANKSWVRNYSSDSYPDLERMIAIDKNAALRSCSWALPQILGNNCIPAGFSSAELMIKAMLQGEREQLIAMVTLMKTWGMTAMLTGRDFTKADSWRDAARKYNGSGYATHNYHGRLATAYVKHSKGTPMKTPTPAPAEPIVLQKGMKGEAVRNLQNDLFALGYKFNSGLDGRFGDETERNVKAFQKDYGVKPIDGKAGRKTLAAIEAAISKLPTLANPPSPEWKERRPGGIIPMIIDLLKRIFKRE